MQEEVALAVLYAGFGSSPGRQQGHYHILAGIDRCQWRSLVGPLGRSKTESVSEWSFTRGDCRLGSKVGGLRETFARSGLFRVGLVT